MPPLHCRLFESLGTAALLDASLFLPHRELEEQILVTNALTACLSCQLVTAPSSSNCSGGGSRVRHITPTLLLRRMAVQLEARCLQPEAVVLQLGLQALVKTRSDLFQHVLVDNPSWQPAAVEEKTEEALASLIPAVFRQLLPAFLHGMQHAEDLQAGQCRASGACMGLLLSRLLTGELCCNGADVACNLVLINGGCCSYC